MSHAAVRFRTLTGDTAIFNVSYFLCVNLQSSENAAFHLLIDTVIGVTVTNMSLCASFSFPFKLLLLKTHTIGTAQEKMFSIFSYVFGNFMTNSNRNFVHDAGKYNERTTTSFVAQIVEVLERRDSKWILGLITYNLVIIYYLCNWVTSTNSIALSAYVNTIFFNVSALLVCLVSIWVEQNSRANEDLEEDSELISIFGHPRFPKTPGYPEYRQSFDSHSQTSLKDFGHGNFVKATFLNSTEKNEKLQKYMSVEKAGYENFVYKSISSLGLEKYEVLALLASSCLSLAAGSLVSLQVVARLTDQPKVHTGRLGLGVVLGLLAHLGTVIGYPDAGLNHVVCRALPCPTVRGCNPILGGNMISALILSGAHFVTHFWGIHLIDTAAAFAVLALTASSMLPLAFYTLNIILQKLPRHMNEQLNKCLREALIVDGVLEFRNERFWSKSFGKLAGTLQVRVRKNANENHVLECVMLRLSKIVSTLTIQEFRESRINDISDDRPTEYYINEVLSSREKNIDATPRCPNYRTSTPETDQNVHILRIEDIIGVDDTPIRSFAKKSERTAISSGQPVNKFENLKIDQKMTIPKCKKVFFKDYLWRGDWTKRNALFYGTIIDFQNFYHFSVPQKSYNQKNEILI